MLKKWDVTIPALTGDAPRRAYIYLPEYYDDDPNRRFPVMYMFDGQNIFLDEDASYGKSWGMYNFMQWTRKPLIIVAVECNRFGERFNEYAPVTYENREHGFIKGKGKLSARPEQLFFSETGMPGKVLFSTFLGDFIEYEVELDNGQSLIVNEYTKDTSAVHEDGTREEIK